MAIGASAVTGTESLYVNGDILSHGQLQIESTASSEQARFGRMSGTNDDFISFYRGVHTKKDLSNHSNHCSEFHLLE